MFSSTSAWFFKVFIIHHWGTFKSNFVFNVAIFSKNIFRHFELCLYSVLHSVGFLGWFCLFTIGQFFWLLTWPADIIRNYIWIFCICIKMATDILKFCSQFNYKLFGVIRPLNIVLTTCNLFSITTDFLLKHLSLWLFRWSLKLHLAFQNLTAICLRNLSFFFHFLWFCFFSDMWVYMN